MRVHFAKAGRVALLTGLTFVGCLSGLTSSTLAAGSDEVPTQYAMFYHPPRDGTSPQTLSAEAKLLIFTNGDESYLRQMRSSGFSGPALEYLMANEVSGPADLINSSSACNAYPFYPNNLTGLAGDFCTMLHPDETNFLHNSRGQRLYSTQSWTDGAGNHTVYLYLMNPSASGWQTYIASHIEALMAGSPYAGVFRDNVDLAPARGQRLEANSDGVVEEYSTTDAYQASMQSLLPVYRDSVGVDMQLWANLTEGRETADNWDAYLPYLDGVMDESFATGWKGFKDQDAWLAQIQRMEEVLRQGKSFVGVTQGSRSDTQMQQFGLASYLLAVDGKAYFRYAASESYYDAWWYPNYASRLGAPLGPRYQNASGAWQRDFTCGSVSVDASTHIGSLTTTRSSDACG